MTDSDLTTWLRYAWLVVLLVLVLAVMLGSREGGLATVVAVSLVTADAALFAGLLRMRRAT